MTAREKEEPFVAIVVDQDGWTKGYQLSIDDENGGRRLRGPKFNGSSRRLLTFIISQESEIDAIQRYLRKARRLIKKAKAAKEVADA
jgi:hypothetical protein